MIITILSEPRSGSTNLTNWFYQNKSFTTFFEPLNPSSKWFMKNLQAQDYSYDTEHLCIKEVYYPHKNWKNIIDMSDKIIILYRKDFKKQLESFLNAVRTLNWNSEYMYEHYDTLSTKGNIEYFGQLKNEFKEKYIDADLFKISYEELYFGNKFQNIVDYLDLDCVKNINFPVGKKYRLDADRLKSII